jgi:hypothetical protein
VDFGQSIIDKRGELLYRDIVGEADAHRHNAPIYVSLSSLNLPDVDIAGYVTHGSPASSPHFQTDVNLAALSIAYRVSWLVLGALALVWGFFAAASLFANFGMSHATAIFGIVATIGLMTTLFVAGRSTVSSLNRR